MERLFVVIILVACSSKHEGDVPLRVANAPTCPGASAKTAAIRIERGTDYMQEGLTGPRLSLSSSWQGRTATVKVGFCTQTSPTITDCRQPAWVAQHETTIGGDQKELVVELPKFELPCADGSVAKN